MEKISQQQLLDAGVHFGHLKKKWNPKMLPYIFMERKGIHIIDLNKTQVKLEESAAALRQIAKSGRKILFVATKKQAKDIVAELANSVNMPFVAERWLGGMLTNFSTIRKSIKKKQSIEKMLTDGSFNNITKKERLMLARQQAKLDRVLGGIENLGRVPAAVFMVDISHEHIALAEAKKLGIKTFGIVDTNSDPTLVDFAVPGNDDASKSIKIITEYLVEAIKEGLADRKRDKEVEEEEETHEDADDQVESAEQETKEEETKEESSETAE